MFVQIKDTVSGNISYTYNIPNIENISKIIFSLQPATSIPSISERYLINIQYKDSNTNPDINLNFDSAQRDLAQEVYSRINAALQTI